MARWVGRVVKIAVINGPNLNLLGQREPGIYGSTTLAEIEARLRDVARELNTDITFSQFNGEGDIINAVHALKGSADGALINAGAYTHTSLAIHDALTSVAVPFAEVHITNIYAREPERRKSLLADAAVAIVAGFGPMSYELALRGLVGKLSQ